jgi:hypothetical protein
MALPKHPETIVIKNKFYPRGLKEIDIWNYYQKVKKQILQETFNRNLMFSIMVDVNQTIIRRKSKVGFIRLTPSNYDNIITGRTVAIYPEMSAYENFGIIDIDIDPSDGFKWAKKTTFDVYNFVMDKMPLVTTATIKFTGKTSFHIICHFRNKMKVDSIRFLLRKFLRESELARVYTIEMKRRAGIPNLDLAPNKFRGNYIALNSLSIWGLRCMEVPYSGLINFDPKKAKI